MSRVRTFLVTLAIWIVLGFASYGVICTAYGNTAQAKSKEPGCVEFATTGNITLYECTDEAGRVWLTNSMGFISFGGN